MLPSVQPHTFTHSITVDFLLFHPLSDALPCGRCSRNHKVLGSKLRSKKS